MSRRLRTEPEIAAALGSALLGTVDVPGEPARAPAGRPWPAGPDPPAARRRHPVGHTGPADVRRRGRQADPLPAGVRPPPGPTAGPPAAAGRRPGRRRDRPPGRRAARRRGQERSAAAGGGGFGVPADWCRTATTSPVPWSCSARAAGPRQELAGIAEACADAGHEVVGIVVAGTVRARPTRSAGHPPDGATPALAVGATQGEVQRDDEHDFGVVGRHSALRPAGAGGGGAQAPPPLVLHGAARAAGRRGGGGPAAAAADRGDQGAGRACRRTSRTTPER